MSKETVFNILVGLLVSIAGAGSITSVKLASVETREENHYAAHQAAIDQGRHDLDAFKGDAERAIERVQADAQSRLDRSERDVNRMLDKIDTNLQYLLKRQIEHDAIEHNIHRPTP